MRLAQAPRPPRTEEEDAPRRVLEGRAELIEDELPLYRALSLALNGRRWRDRVREQLSVLQHLLAQDAQVLDAVNVARHRGEVEGWSSAGVMARLAMAAELRGELSARIRKRLRLPRGSSDSLEVLLRLLRDDVTAATRHSRFAQPQESERLVLEARLTPIWFDIPLTFVAMYAIIRPSWIAGIVMLLGWYAVNLLFLRPQAMVVTNRRVLRNALILVGNEIALGSIQRIKETGLLTRALELELTGGARTELRQLSRRSCRELRTVLEIHRRLELPAAPDGERTGEQVVFDSSLGEEGRPQKGTVVLRPGYLAFLPEDAGADALAIAAESELGRTGVASNDEARIPVRLILEQLRLLPAPRFDALLRNIAGRRGALWTSADAQPLLDGERLTCFSADGQQLRGTVDELQRPIARALLAGWNAPREVPPQRLG